MRDARRGPCLEHESLASFRILNDVRSQQFEGDLPVQFFVVSPIDHAHAAFAEQGGDSILPQGPTQEGFRIWLGYAGIHRTAIGNLTQARPDVSFNLAG